MGSKNNEPSIRFIGFNDNWEQRKFEDVFVKLQNNSLSRAQLNYEEGIANNVHYGDILIKFGECLDVKKEQLPYINNDILIDNYRASFLNNGDIIFADAAEDETVGKCSEIQGLTTQVVISGLHTIPCRPIQNFASGYLGYYLNSNAYHNQLLPLMQGTKVSSISRSSLNETYVIYPKSKEEQVQIGLFFETLDNFITLHQRKLDNLETFKKTFLNKLFPTSNNLFPGYRFKEFNNDWEKRKLKEIGNIITGSTPSTLNDEYYSNDGMKWVTPTDIDSNIVQDTAKKLSNKGVEVARVVPENTILVTCIASIGKNAIALEKLSFNQQINSLTPNKEYNPYFLFTESFLWSNNMKKMGASGMMQMVNKTEFSELETLVPTKQEQDKIGNIFKELDNLITLYQQKLKHLKTMKKYFLNNMFI